jgi:hypothetical protein
LALLCRPLVLIALAFGLLAVLIRPWGEFPLNDDWQYARLVLRLSQSGLFRVDVGIAPSLVLQAYLAAGVVTLLGFSHLLLRLLTMAAAVIMVWVVERILATVGARPLARAFACALLMTNPLFLSLAFTFMTDIYGYLVALLAVWAWFVAERRVLPRMGQPIVDYGTALGVAALAGASFWIRQFCLLVYPALVLPGLVAQLRAWDLPGLRRSFARVVVGGVVLAAIVGLYFAWAKSTQTYRPEFGNHLKTLHEIRPRLWRLYAFEVLIYLTAFSFPAFVLTRYRHLKWRRLVLAVGALGALMWNIKPLQLRLASYHHHVDFPYSANLISNVGVGPYTLSAGFTTGAGLPHWSAQTWWLIEWALIALAYLWALWWSTSSHFSIRSRRLRHFALTFALLSLAAAVQAYGSEVLDRYYLPLVLALALLFGSMHVAVPGRASRRAWLRPLLAGLALLPMAWFSVAGVHDYFRWNEGRWALVNAALAVVEPNNLDGGFEVNGWLNYENYRAGRKPARCAGDCKCAVKHFSCSDDTYQISMDVGANRVIVAEWRPRYWLLPEGMIYLTRRR